MNTKTKLNSNNSNNSVTGKQAATANVSSPFFRSVSMGAAEPQRLLGAHSHSQVHSPQVHSPQVPCGRPVQVLSKSHSAPIPDNCFAKDASFRQEHQQQEQEWVWTLTQQQLIPLPFYHPVERTAVTISTDDIPLAEITKRISTFLKYHSILANYNNESSRVSCTTEGLVKFVIQLWQSDTDSGVILEIQRRQGCCIAMQAIRHHLVEAIQHGTLYTDKYRSPTGVPPTRATCGIFQNLIEQSMTSKSLPPPPVSPCASSSALDLVKKLLQNERYDAQRLALESLCSLTNPAQVLLRDADQVARSILCDPEWQALLGRYFDKNHLGPPATTYLWQAEADNNNPEIYQQPECELLGELHFLALKVVSQAVETFLPGLQTREISSDDPFWTNVLQALYYNLAAATHRPLEAAWSIRCLRHLQAAQTDFIQLISSQSGLHGSLVHAHDFGRQHHRALEQETEQWMSRLGFAY